MKQLELGDVMVIDLEERTLQCAHNDVLDLPAGALSILRHHLHSSFNMFFTDGLARSFLRLAVQYIEFFPTNEVSEVCR